MAIVTLALPFFESTKYYCWRDEESRSREDEKSRVEKSRGREVEREAKRMLTIVAFGEEVEILSTEAGKPLPVGNTHLTFSHSGKYVILATAPYNIGIDIQQYTPKLLRVSHKFVAETEELLLHPVEEEKNRQIHFMWCAKEAIFKLYGENLPFKDIVAHHLDLGPSGHINFTVNGIDHQVAYSFFDDFCFCIAR